MSILHNIDMGRHGYHNHGGCGRYGRYGYGYPYFGGFGDYRINGLVNEYAQLNDLALRNNSLYYQNLLQYQRPSVVNNTTIIQPYPSYGAYGYTNPYLFN
jgi:hypothetical protein